MASWGPRTVRARVTATALAVVALALLAVGAAIVLGVRDALVRNAEATASAQARSVVPLAQAGRLPALLEVDALDRTLLQVLDADGRVLAASPQLTGLSGLVAPASGDLTPRTLHVALPGAEPVAFRAVLVATQSPAGPVTIVAASSLEDADRAIGLLAGLMVAGGVAALAVVGIVTWLVVRRALQPVERLRAEVDAITSDDVGRRVEVPASGDEVARLATTMNGMLGRVESAVAQQRRLVADVSHEIRSPLASLRTLLEVALAHPQVTDWPEVGRDLLADTERLSGLAADLLLLARLDAGEATAGETVDLGDLVREVVRRRAEPPVGVEVQLDAGVHVAGGSTPLARIIGNLLDNAERHAVTRVDVRVTTRPDASGGARGGTRAAGVVEVGNDGPLIAIEDAERIFERFVRLDDARTRDTGGSGLGLPIARQLARAHGGDLRLEAARPGTTFVLTLPLAGREETAPTLRELRKELPR